MWALRVDKLPLPYVDDVEAAMRDHSDAATRAARDWDVRDDSDVAVSEIEEFVSRRGDAQLPDAPTWGAPDCTRRRRLSNISKNNGPPGWLTLAAGHETLLDNLREDAIKPQPVRALHVGELPLGYIDDVEAAMRDDPMRPRGEPVMGRAR